jgi:hypothetical protein
MQTYQIFHFNFFLEIDPLRRGEAPYNPTYSYLSTGDGAEIKEVRNLGSATDLKKVEMLFGIHFY